MTMIRLVCPIYTREKDRLLFLCLDLWAIRTELDMSILKRKIHMADLFPSCCSKINYTHKSIPRAPLHSHTCVPTTHLTYHSTSPLSKMTIPSSTDPPTWVTLLSILPVCTVEENMLIFWDKKEQKTMKEKLMFGRFKEQISQIGQETLIQVGNNLFIGQLTTTFLRSSKNSIKQELMFINLMKKETRQLIWQWWTNHTKLYKFLQS